MSRRRKADTADAAVRLLLISSCGRKAEVSSHVFEVYRTVFTVRVNISVYLSVELFLTHKGTLIADAGTD
jgi:hypothetical protein